MRLWGGRGVRGLKGGRMLVVLAVQPDNLVFTRMRQYSPSEVLSCSMRKPSMRIAHAYSNIPGTSQLFITDKDDHHW